MTGLEVLDRLARLPHPPWTIMLSAHGNTRAAAEAVKKGAQDYITKPFDLNELLFLIRRHHAQIRLGRELKDVKDDAAPSLLGRSPVMAERRAQLTRVAESRAQTVLLLGPSGSGKSEAARLLHSLRGADRPFVQVACASLPADRLEAELFGTAGEEERPGLVARADGGTLVLDEFVDLPLAVQAKLVSFIETHRYRPVGDGEERLAELTLVAITNRDPQEAIANGLLREDLYYRLSVMPLTLPSLRERPEDLPLLVGHLAERHASGRGGAGEAGRIRLAPEAMEALQTHDWPGNVRELSNLIERLTILSPGRLLGLADLPPELRAPAARTQAAPGGALPGESAPGAPLEQLSGETAARERQVIVEALERAGGRKVLAAEWLGISRHALKRRMQKFKIGEYE
jgi:DNA-binding NtrC family response regulator